ncbi:MAG TPA: hypothetical protein PLT26_14180 [Anaerolineaceae bacterium]|nr:hypothetical protein [Anaerolineaceae bacterium]
MLESNLKLTPSRPFPYYPFLLALYPTLALFSVNPSQVKWIVLVRPLVLFGAASALIYAGLYLLLRRQDRAAVATALLLTMFFLFGYFYPLLETGLSAQLFVLGAIWLALPLLTVRQILVKQPVYQIITLSFNVISLFLLVIPVFKISASHFQLTQMLLNPPQPDATLTAQTRPDIYFIVLDGYERADTMMLDYDYDNSDFIQALKDLGFIVPDCAQSNYMWTPLSLSSTLNMEYQETLHPAAFEHLDQTDWIHYHGLIQRSAVRANLEALGYQTVAFESSFAFTDIPDADYYINVSRNPFTMPITRFESVLFQTTALRPFTDTWVSLAADEGHCDQLNYTLDQLPVVAELPGPKFTYLHFPAPHNPFVFTVDGEFAVTNEEIGYPNMVSYINNRMLVILQEIIENAETPPIIVLQSDHGWTTEHRLQNLNALYLPGNSTLPISDTLTPVNTFRIVFNTYFGGHYPLLPDVSYNSPEWRKLDLTEAPFICP